jgi:hypothetical protein
MNNKDNIVFKDISPCSLNIDSFDSFKVKVGSKPTKATTILKDGGFYCTGCKGVFIPQLPIDMALLGELGLKFADLHNYCKER